MSDTPEQRQENLKALMEVLRRSAASDYVNWVKLAEMYRGLDAQFTVPPRKVEWWERIPWPWGWWWRKPWGWLLGLPRLVRMRPLGRKEKGRFWVEKT